MRALFSVPRTSLELLPYYSRLVATLSPFMKGLPSMLLSMLEEEFNFFDKQEGLFILIVQYHLLPGESLL